MEEPSLGPAVRLAARLLRHWLEAGEFGVLKRVRVCRRGAGCLREDGAVQRSGVKSDKSGVQSERVGSQRGVGCNQGGMSYSQLWRSGVQSAREEWGTDR